MSEATTDYPKKLIEVSIPLKEINEASAREKSIRHGHPSTLHLWWARRPLAAARAVLFCQLVDDPSGYVDELIADKARKKRAEEELAIEMKMAPHVSSKVEDILVLKERDRLHDIVKELVLWENTSNDKVLNKARKEIQKSWARTCRREGKPEDAPMPPFLDPFAGGGAIPLEAQRLGLESHASDLNPVAVLINKAMIEIPPKFADMPPVHPEARKEMGTTGWKGAAGLAVDVRRYGQWMRDEAFKRIGHFYPPYTLTQELIDSRPDLQEAGYKGGEELTVVAWLWARTVPSPNPALSGKSVPLISSFFLSTKKGNEFWVEPKIRKNDFDFDVRLGVPPDPEKVNLGTKAESRGANFLCLLSGVPIDANYIRDNAKKGKMGARLMATVCNDGRRRFFLPPTAIQEEAANSIEAKWVPNQSLPEKALGFRVQAYGMTKWSDLFTQRQLHMLSTFADLVNEARSKVNIDAQLLQQFPADLNSLEEGGDGIQAYADSVSVYLAFAVDKMTDTNSCLCTWQMNPPRLRATFGRHALPMTWDYAEASVFGDAAGDYQRCVRAIEEVLEKQPASRQKIGQVSQASADEIDLSGDFIFSTDPPYYDNIGYADLSDYFYVWMRRTIGACFPRLMSTMLSPKEAELIATPFRHGGKRDVAKDFFEAGFLKVFAKLRASQCKSAPLTIFYAFKQTETDSEGGVGSAGWGTLLEGLLGAGYQITGTWPMRSELKTRNVGRGTNALASSIVLVCRIRPDSSPMATRREFVQSLQKGLPHALRELQHGNVAPVDLPQSSIGPGMGIFSEYSKVIESDGSPMSVQSALKLINQAVDEFLSEQEAEMDEWTRFAITWFSENAFTAGDFGDALNIATAKGVTVDGVKVAGIIESGRGKVRILRPGELSMDWDPMKDDRLTVWEIVHHLIRILKQGSEDDAARIIRSVGGFAHDAKALCYRLYTICEQQKWADEAQDYNMLMTEWSRLQDRADQIREVQMQQDEMFE